MSPKNPFFLLLLAAAGYVEREKKPLGRLKLQQGELYTPGFGKFFKSSG